MPSEITPIELGLTTGTGLTLWASRWEEDGEEWEAFLGHGDDLYLFPDAAHLAAFIRSDAPHDLLDHPHWEVARQASLDELAPRDDHRFNIVGVPQLTAGKPDVWTVAELADTVAILHSLAEVCELTDIEDVLGSTPGFDATAEGPGAFTGRLGRKLWNGIVSVVEQRWGSVVAALDAIITSPDVDADAVARVRAEAGASAVAAPSAGAASDGAAPTADDAVAAAEPERDPDLAFWDEVGIDCLQLTHDGRTGWTLRCYLDDTAVFLAIDGQIHLYPSPAALEEYLADPTAENDLSGLDAWTTIREAIDGGEASVLAGPENTYVLDGLADDLAEGADRVDADQLALAVELLTDAAQARGDEETAAALSTATPLGNLVRSITDPSPDRLPPLPPFDDEAAAWRALIESFTAAIDWK